ATHHRRRLSGSHMTEPESTTPASDSADSPELATLTVAGAPELQTESETSDFEVRLRRESAATIGRFLVIASLGKGGMGEVFLAYDPMLRRRIALKLLHERGEQATRALIREAQRLARLSHPNVVQVHEIGEHGAAAFVAMEYVEGATLRTWLAAPGRRRDWRTTTRVLIQAGSRLAAAHDAGPVHRDIKPDNIMIGDDERARVLDFGLARADVALDPDAEPVAIVGTPAYLAPECIVGRPGDALSDQFGFCVTAFECLFGERPFVARTQAELFANILNGRVRELAHDPELPARVRLAITRGLAVEPRARWPSMHALLSELEDVLSQFELRARLNRLRETGALDSHETADGGPRLRSPARIYGRASELDRLVSAFARV